MARACILFLLLVTLAASPARAEDWVEQQRETIGRLAGAAMVNDQAYERLAYLCDRYGHRLSGTPQLEAAIDWLASEMEAAGFSNVHREPVQVPVWVRGEESARVLEPAHHRLNILGLGRSVATPPGGVEAEVVVVGDYDELEALGREGVEGRIVCYDVPFSSYGETVRYRSSGASRAAALGAVAVFVRSVGPISYDTPHTGALRYDEAQPKIPAAAVTIENATMLRRMQERGERIVARLEMEAQTLDDATSHNLVGEIRGERFPEEVVIIGGHIDSWDVGQGAQDDGAGCILSMEAARLIHALDLRPDRTIRVVLWTNEENGLEGGRQYAEAHAGELEHVVAAIESDSGNGRADGFRLDIRDAAIGLPARERGDELPVALASAQAAALSRMERLSAALAPIGGGSARLGGGGADISPMVARGVVGMGLAHDTSRYFEIHHTWADTFEKIIKADLDHNVAVMAGMAWLLAEAPRELLPLPPLSAR